jgi:hypothetical protein
MRTAPQRTRSRRVERRTALARREKVELALWLAEWNAQWGDYRRGLEHLDVADRLSHGSTSGRFARKRRTWERAAGLSKRR